MQTKTTSTSEERAKILKLKRFLHLSFSSISTMPLSMTMDEFDNPNRKRSFLKKIYIFLNYFLRLYIILKEEETKIHMNLRD